MKQKDFFKSKHVYKNTLSFRWSRGKETFVVRYRGRDNEGDRSACREKSWGKCQGRQTGRLPSINTLNTRSVEGATLGTEPRRHTLGFLTPSVSQTSSLVCSWSCLSFTRLSTFGDFMGYNIYWSARALLIWDIKSWLAVNYVYVSMCVAHTSAHDAMPWEES